MNQEGKNQNKLYLRPISASICNLFEDLLDEHNITIPSEEREGEDDEARIFSDIYFGLEDEITEIIAGLCLKIKTEPNVVINVEDYNGFVEEKYDDISYKYREIYRLRAVPKDKIMIAVLDENYYGENRSYPPCFDSDLPFSAFVFNTPEEFIKKWNELDEGAWYWVFDNSELICSGAVDPNDIEIFVEYFDTSFEEPSKFEEIKECVEALLEDFDLSGIEVTEDDYKTISERLANDKKVLEMIVKEYLGEIREILDNGLYVEKEINSPKYDSFDKLIEEATARSEVNSHNKTTNTAQTVEK